MALFETGTVVATRAFMGTGENPVGDMVVALRRHASGDWGNLDEHDAQMNKDALTEPFARIMSVYKTEAGVKFYIITEHDRSVTTVLLPGDY